MIIFTRHYLTEWNTRELIQTYTDNSIIRTDETDLHINQWKKLLPKDFIPDEIWCSTLKRTSETAKMLNYEPTQYSQLLNELKLPEYEGKYYLAMNDHWKISKQFIFNIYEKYAELFKFWNELDKTKNHLIFTHGISIRLIYLILQKEYLPKYFPDIFNIPIGNLGQLQIDNNENKTIKNIMIN